MSPFLRLSSIAPAETDWEISDHIGTFSTLPTSFLSGGWVVVEEELEEVELDELEVELLVLVL